MSNSKVSEGNALVREAESHLKTGFFKWSPDFDSAASCYQKAAMAYKNGRALDKALEAYNKLGECHYKNNSRYHAGKAYEDAGLICRDIKDFGKAMAQFDRASKMFLEDGTPDTAALCLDRAGKIVQMSHPEWAIKMFKKAAEIYENEDNDRLRSASELLDKAARLHVGLQQYDEAVENIMHQQSLLGRVAGSDHGAGARLSCALILVHLTRGDPVKAEQSLYASCESVSGFEESEEYLALSNLLEAFNNCNQDKVSEITNTPLFKYMDTAYAKLARSLRIPIFETKEQRNISPVIPVDTEKVGQKAEEISDALANIQFSTEAADKPDPSKSETSSPAPASTAAPSSSPSKSPTPIIVDEIDLC